VLCLQEITPTTAPAWLADLEGAGLHVAISAWPARPERVRRLGVLIAGVQPITIAPIEGFPWPERHLAAVVRVAGMPTTVHSVHAPLSSKPDRVKVFTLERLFEIAVSEPAPRIIAGDLNTPQYESREGEISTFARDRAGLLRPDRDERHDRAELGLIAGLPAAGWTDAFRSLHGYGRRDRSWTYPSRPFGYRLDHVLASPHFRPLACDYLHDWRAEGLSDHSPVWAEIGPA
jgi:endonuclease/exonuclease/phosphatase family metal-dependent hydrolase